MGAPDDDATARRVAIVGSGPAGFYTVQHLFNAAGPPIHVDMFDRLATPFGLVRHGVAPDHQKIKSVTAVYHKLASDPRFRFFGAVEYGRDIDLAELRELYDQIVFATGAQTDRRMGVPGEDLAGSHPATEFVAWYNGHPDYANHEFDLGCGRAVVVGVGNVAVDVARILCRTPEELRRTDIADHAVEALERSRIEEVLLLGRRGPAQAAFTNPELKELGELPGAETSALAREVAPDALTRRALEESPDRSTSRKLEILKSYVGRREPDKPRRLILRFLVSPVELLGDDRVEAVRLTRNELYASDDGSLRPRATERTELIEAGLVFRSVGYRGVRLEGLPFEERRGVVPNSKGRVIDLESGRPLRGIYVSGWIKRGPSGVIGTNKPDAGETVGCMLEDLQSGSIPRPREGASDATPRFLQERGVRYISYHDWLEIDAREVAMGKAQGRPRVKFTDHTALLEALQE